MANLLKLESGKLLAFVGKLAKAGVTLEMAEECLDDDAALQRRADGFKNANAPAPVPAVPMWRKVEGNPNAIEFNRDAPPKMPFDGASVEWTLPGKTGWGLLELKGDKLYVDGAEVILKLDTDQKGGKSIQGDKLRHRLKNDPGHMHPNALDALFENQHLLPEPWKQDENGQTRYIFFWAVGFRRQGGRLYVRYLYWNDGRWDWYCNWLALVWYGQSPAAVSASPGTVT